MKTTQTLCTLMLAVSLGAGMILVWEAGLSRNNDHQEHSDHQDRNGMGSVNGNGSATCSGRDSGATNKNEKSKPGPERGLTAVNLFLRSVMRLSSGPLTAMGQVNTIWSK